MNETVCPNCGHCFKAGPMIIRPSEKCCCSVYEWPAEYSNGKPMPPVCDKYEADILGNCKTCEHDEECHE